MVLGMPQDEPVADEDAEAAAAADPAADPVAGEGVAPESVHTRASGRPPEEESSDDPEAQAQAVLEESEDRTARRADAS